MRKLVALLVLFVLAGVITYWISDSDPLEALGNSAPGASQGGNLDSDSSIEVSSEPLTGGERSTVEPIDIDIAERGVEGNLSHQQGLRALARRSANRRSLPGAKELLADEFVNSNSRELSAEEYADFQALIRTGNKDLSRYQDRRRELQSRLADAKIAAGDYLIETRENPVIRNVVGAVYVGKYAEGGKAVVVLHPGECPELEALREEGASIALGCLESLKELLSMGDEAK